MSSNYRGRMFDFVVALVLLCLAGPLFGAIALLILWDDGRPIFYAGERLGQDKEPFTMYKFRTLVPNAEALLGADMVEQKESLITCVGKFLRPTRLDELPQLLNVLKGDMQIVGPRPVRRRLYEKRCKEIPRYEERFSVPPGLVGPSQLFTPHACPKIFRTIIDNRAIRQYQTGWEKTYLIVRTIAAVTKKTLQAAGRWFERPPEDRRSNGALEEETIPGRSHPRGATAYLNEPYLSDDYETLGQIVDMNSEAFRVRTDRQLESFPCHIKIAVDHSASRAGGKRTKCAFVKCEPLRQIALGSETRDYVMQYEPVSPISRYVIHQYFLRESLAVPE